ncbi:MAG: hypothetical protein ACXWEN_09110 [Actinomycetota bacterium]
MSQHVVHVVAVLQLVPLPDGEGLEDDEHTGRGEPDQDRVRSPVGELTVDCDFRGLKAQELCTCGPAGEDVVYLLMPMGTATTVGRGGEEVDSNDDLPIGNHNGPQPLERLSALFVASFREPLGDRSVGLLRHLEGVDHHIDV